MKLILIAITLSITATQSSVAQDTEKRRWQQGVRYEIEAELDTVARQLNASMQITYRNNAPDTLNRIYLQVPSNAFHDDENTAVREMNRFSGGNMDFDQDGGHEVTVQSVQFISIGHNENFPILAYNFKDTILDLRLPTSLAPGDSMLVNVAFIQKFDSETERSERIPANHVLWFPKIAVYDQDGWQADPFHFMMQASDIYSEFADFEVALTVPGDYIVAASGELVSGNPGWQEVVADTSTTEQAYEAWHDSLKQVRFDKARLAGPRRLVFRAQSIHDFTWSASPEFTYFESELSGTPVHLLAWGDGGIGWLKVFLLNHQFAWTHLLQHFGEYPFEHLTVTHSLDRDFAVPWHTMLGHPEFFELAFELSKIWVPGMVATNGVKESWLSTGMQTYLGKSLSEKKYGPKGYDTEEAQEDMNWLERNYPLPSIDGLLRNLTHLYSESGANEPISQRIDEYRDPVGLAFNVYLKAELFYEMLHFVVGDSSFKAATRELVSRHAASHIAETEMREAFETAAGQELGWFFDQWLRATPTVDYKQGKVRKRKLDDDSWVTEIDLERKGDGIMPVEVEIELGDGQRVVKRWDGKEKQTTLTVETPKKPREVNVDPDDRIMDSNALNNTNTRLEFRPDLPLLKFIHMPRDAYLVLWRPLIGYNGHDSIRLGARTRSSYRAFYNNLDLEFMFGLDSHELDLGATYSHPLTRKNLLQRYRLMARKNEGRFEADARVSLKGSHGVLAVGGSRSLEFGLNFSTVLNDSYTFREVRNDTGTTRLDEWQDVNVLTSYAEGRMRADFDAGFTEAKVRGEIALPGGDAQFTKLSGRWTSEARAGALKFLARGNLATSFGPDRLPAQDQFRAEGATARERFQNDILKTGDTVLGFSRRFVEGGGFMRGYAGQPLPAERFVTANLEITTREVMALAIRPFLFYDVGRIWSTRKDGGVGRGDAGFGFTFLGDELNLFGGNLSVFEDLNAKLVFPVWLSDPLPGEKHTKFRWYIVLGKSL